MSITSICCCHFQNESQSKCQFGDELSAIENRKSCRSNIVVIFIGISPRGCTVDLSAVSIATVNIHNNKVHITLDRYKSGIIALYTDSQPIVQYGYGSLTYDVRANCRSRVLGQR